MCNKSTKSVKQIVGGSFLPHASTFVPSTVLIVCYVLPDRRLGEISPLCFSNPCLTEDVTCESHFDFLRKVATHPDVKAWQVAHNKFVDTSQHCD